MPKLKYLHSVGHVLDDVRSEQILAGASKSSCPQVSAIEIRIAQVTTFPKRQVSGSANTEVLATFLIGFEPLVPDCSWCGPYPLDTVK